MKTWHQVNKVQIDENNHLQRIDNFLFQLLKDIPKSRIYRILRKGEVRVNGKRVKPTNKLQTGDEVRIPPLFTDKERSHEVPALEKQTRLLKQIIYEDDEILLLNKPAGVAAHAGSGIKHGVIEILQAARQDLNFLSLVHRLDRATSGCLLLAKSRIILCELQELWRENKVQKCYSVLVHGKWDEEVQEVDASLQRNQLQSGERMVMVDSEGKPALTRFEIIKSFQDYTLLNAYPVTGRTHQIRVHCAHQGHPIAGDEKYSSRELQKEAGEAGIKRLFLHASTLTFRLSGHTAYSVHQAPLAADLAVLLQAWGAE